MNLQEAVAYVNSVVKAKEEFWLYKLDSAKEECARKTEECERLKKELEALRALLKEADAGQNQTSGVIALDVEKLLELMKKLKAVEHRCFLYVAVSKASVADIPLEIRMLLTETVIADSPEGLNILAEGDVNVEKLTNNGTMLSVDKLGKMVI